MKKIEVKRWSRGRWMLTYIALVAPPYAIEKAWLDLGEGWAAWLYAIAVVIAAVVTLERLEAIDVERQIAQQLEREAPQ